MPEVCGRTDRARAWGGRPATGGLGAGTQGGIENGGVNAPRTCLSSARVRERLHRSTFWISVPRTSAWRQGWSASRLRPTRTSHRGRWNPSRRRSQRQSRSQTRRVEPTESAPEDRRRAGTPPDYQVTAPTVVPPIQTNEPLQAPHPRRTVAPLLLATSSFRGLWSRRGRYLCYWCSDGRLWRDCWRGIMCGGFIELKCTRRNAGRPLEVLQVRMAPRRCKGSIL